MARIEEFSKSGTRQNRYFSESFKKVKVREIERNITTVSEVSKEYEVSCTAVYKWLYKYSVHYKKQIRQVIEPMSDTQKIKELKAKIKELEQLVGQKQIQLEFKEKMIDIAEQMYGVDIKKNLVRNSPVVLDQSGKTPMENECFLPSHRNHKAEYPPKAGQVSCAAGGES